MRMIKTLLTIGIGILFLQGCAVNPSLQVLEKTNVSPVVQVSPIEDRLAAVPAIDGPKITIAVYGFRDATGQRKPADNIANLSSAVTQGSEVWVIKALQDVGNGVWFEVVERVGMDNLIKERQLIRSTREVYEKELPNGPTPLKPMLFAGLILEGGIVGYDSNTAVGGAGARYLGVGAQTEYRVDTVTVVMRLVSVSTGKVLMSIATEKTIASYRSGADIFKFFDLGTKLVEAETGYSVNEPVNYAVRAAIEQGVIEMVHEGEQSGLWKFKDVTYTGKLPEVRPLVLEEALKKWPDARLNCSADDLCVPTKDDE
jgi:curli production assembly/transport component CsgG